MKNKKIKKLTRDVVLPSELAIIFKINQIIDILNSRKDKKGGEE